MSPISIKIRKSEVEFLKKTQKHKWRKKLGLVFGKTGRQTLKGGQKRREDSQKTIREKGHRGENFAKKTVKAKEFELVFDLRNKQTAYDRAITINERGHKLEAKGQGPKLDLPTSKNGR